MMMFASESAIAQCSPDVTPPVAVCQDLDLYLDGSGTAILTLGQLDGGSFDGCGPVGLSGLTQTIFTCSNLGPNPGIGMTVTDGSGNTTTCTAIITVYDTVAPVAVCQNITVNLDGTGNATIIGSDIDGGSTDGCGTPALSIASITSFTCADIGPNNVWLTVTDVTGNVDSCMAIVTIADTVAPTAICQNINAYLNPFGSVTIVPSQINNGSSDVCSAVTLALSQTTFNCDSIGPRTVYLYVTDAAGNSDTCSSTVTVFDTLPPNVFGSNVNVHLDSNGGVRIDSSDINTTTNDNCGISTITLSQDTFSCVDAPIATITMTATDSSGNSSSADFSVFILDTIFPLVICKDTTVYLDATGNVTIDTSYTNDGSWDNCNLVLTLSQSSFNCNTLGANTVTMYGTDASNNVDSCQLIVTVLDTLVPVAICQAAPIAFLDSNGNLVIDSSVINNGSTDNCNFTITLSATTFTCADIGDTLIEMYVTDASGNSDTCSTTLTIGDNIAPIVLCRDTTVYLDANGGIRIDSSYTDNGSTDNCEIKTMTLSLDTFTCANVGTNIITMTVTDSAGNSSVCNSTVTVLDIVTPTIFCKDTTVYLDAAGNFIIDTSFTNDGSFDNCDFILTLSKTIFTCTDTGANIITMTATDASGNISTCTSIVTVLDTIAPVLTTKPATVYLDSMGSVTLVDSNVVLGIAEACPDTVIVTPRDFDCDSIGARTVQVIAIDESGNADTMSAVVTIVDNISPDAMCQDTTVYLDANGGFRIDSSYIENGSWDNCSIETITLSNDTFSCVNEGANVITMTVTDSSGNTSTCTATVTVFDTIAPVAVCQDTTIYLDASGNFTIDATFVDNGSSDNCLFTDSLSTTTFTCTDTGANTVTLYITDASGNVHSCTSTVTVIDNIAPTAICMDTTVYLNDSGQVIIDSSFVDGGSFDNCTYTVVLSDSIFTCADAGPNVITVLLTDASGNVSSCTATVTVLDSVPPVAICKDTTIYLDASGAAIIFPIDVNEGTYDNCYSVNINTNATTFACNNVGPNAVLLIATDASGNVDTCIAIVNVLDTFGPTAICMDTTIYLDATGSFTFDSSFVDNGSYDDCSGVTMSLSDTTYTCADLGINPTTLYVTDTSRNVDSCISMVTVLDTITPVANCKDTTIYLGASGLLTIDSSFVNDSSYDNCEFTLAISQSSFTCADTGANIITLTAQDASGNSSTCTATVTILDTVPPTAICKNATIFLDSMGNASIGLSDINDGSFDNCAIDTMYLSKDTFTCADLGTNSVTLTVVDVNGNIDSCTGTVTVYDVLSPFITCKDDTLYLNGTGAGSVIAMNLVDSVWDNCSFTVTASPTIFDCNKIGVNPVRVIVTDAGGRTSDCYSNLTVLDTLAPVAVCNSPTVFLNAIGVATITVADINNGSSDNCAISTMTISQSSFDCSHLGANTITLTVTDVSGNVSTCTSTVTVIDNIAPTAICQDITVYLDSTGNVTIDSTDTDNGSTDNCSIVTMSLSQTAFDCSHVGIANTVTVTVTDQSGNVSTCTSTVTVIDNVNPTAICQDATVYLDATGNITISATDVDGGSNDACGITMTISDSLFNCVDTGSNTVTLFVTDASGNVSLCNSNVTVLDTLNPIVICNSPTVYLDALGNVSITAAQIDNGSTDNCTIASIVISDTTFDCSNLGTNSVTLIVTDVSGNVDSCISTVTVVDTINPIARCKSATVYLNSLGTVIITSLDVDNGSTDNCNITTLTLSRTSFTCSEVGPNNVTMTVTDPSGNVNSCVAIVTVLDTLAPTAVCQNLTIKLDSNGTASIVALDVEGGSFDNCGIASIVVNKTNFDCSNLGANTVILTVTDLYGNASTCSANVTVEDDIAPIVYCPADKQRVVKNTNCAYIVEDFIGEIAIWDNCSSDDVVLTQSPAAGTELLLENVSQTITITAIDANGTGNSSTCSFEVYVRCVKQLDIPQFISPNGDGLNDTWEIPELVNYPANTVKVFNRWGNLVFEQKGYYTGWNGSANVNRGLTRLMDNKTLPEGTYFYIIDLGDGGSIEPYNGFLQLKR